MAYPFLIQKKDKPCVMVNIYNGTKKEKLIKMEEKLSAAGFQMDDRLQYIGAEQAELQKNFEKYLPVSRELFENAGLKMVVPTKSMIPQIKELQKQLKTIPFYEIPYITDEEMCSSGRVKCVINKEGSVCAVSAGLYDNITHGWSGILKEYQKGYGIAVMLWRNLLLHAQEKNATIAGMISERNKQSIRFHFKMGFHWTGRYAEYWVLNA